MTIHTLGFLLTPTEKKEIQEMENLHKLTQESCLAKLDAQKKEIDRMPDFTQYGPYNFSETIKWNNRIYGVYLIRYKERNDQIVCIGQGVLSNRKVRYGEIFRNGGEGLQHENSESGCQAARKMYEIDSNISNFSFSYIHIPNEMARKEVEIILQDKYKPICNSEHMAGK